MKENNDLLIIGAGGHGRVVKEVAEAIGIYGRIDFADDNSPEAVGRLNDLECLAGRYHFVFVGIGNNALRRRLLQQLERLGCCVPVLIHPTAYISKSCRIGAGTVVEPKAIVNAGAQVGSGCIISVGAIVDHDAVVQDAVHVNAGTIVKAGATVAQETKLEAGQVVLGYAAR